MCGIYCIFTLKKLHKVNKIYNEFIKGISQIQNRGYDSAGVMYVVDDTKVVIKCVSNSKSLAISQLSHNKNITTNYTGVLLGHTRWATHGSNNELNTHPHSCYNNRFYIVHNGIFENYLFYKNKLFKQNIASVSDTDTEVIANLISFYVEVCNLSVYDAIYKVSVNMIGNSSLVICDTKDTDKLYLINNGNRLLVGLKDDIVSISSEISAFDIDTTVYISNDGVSVIDKSQNQINTLFDFLCVTTDERVEVVKTSKTILSKEIREQIHYLKNINNFEFVDIQKYEYILLVGCGSSYIASLYGKLLFNKRGMFNVICINACDFDIDYVPKNKKMLAILISQSGETMDIINVCNILHSYKIETLSFTNTISSSISRIVNKNIFMDIGKEMSVASTKSFTATLNFYHSLTNNIVYFKYLDIFYKYASSIDVSNMIDYDNVFIVGNGIYKPISEEASLKMKELCYFDTHSYPIRELKHGPFAIVTKKSLVFIIGLNISIENLMNTNSEITSREGNTILIVPDSNQNQSYTFDNIITVPNTQESPFLVTILFQILAMKIAIQKNNNVDNPRNLAKSVTVI